MYSIPAASGAVTPEIDEIRAGSRVDPLSDCSQRPTHRSQQSSFFNYPWFSWARLPTKVT